MRVLLDSNAYAQLMRGRDQVSRIVRDAETGADLVSADRHFAHVDGIAWVRLRAGRGRAGPHP